MHAGSFRRQGDGGENVSGHRDFSMASALANTWIRGCLWHVLQSEFPESKNSFTVTAIKSRVSLALLPLALQGLGAPLIPPKWFWAFLLCSAGSCSWWPVASPAPLSLPAAAIAVFHPRLSPNGPFTSNVCQRHYGCHLALSEIPWLPQTTNVWLGCRNPTLNSWCQAEEPPPVGYQTTAINTPRLSLCIKCPTRVENFHPHQLWDFGQ